MKSPARDSTLLTVSFNLRTAKATTQKSPARDDTSNIVIKCHPYRDLKVCISFIFRTLKHTVNKVSSLAGLWDL